MASRKPSTEIPARRAPAALADDRDARFQALLRTACVKAAGVGALSALVGAVPGAGVLLRYALGELADMAAVGAIQEKLIEDTLALYELPLPEALRKPLITQISALGAGASVGVDALGRRLLGRFGSKLGGGVFSRVAPLVGVLTSALGNAATTYAIGRRAEAFAKMGVAPAESLVDAFRAFTGLDERRVWEWSVSATKEALATVGRVTEKVKAMNPFARGENADSDQGESEGAAKRGAKAAKSAKAAKPPRDAATEAAAPGATKRSTAKNTATNKATAKKTGAANKATAAKKRTAGSATAGPAASAKQPRTAKTASTTKAASTSKTAPAAKKPRTRRATGAV
ncbi:hypothetical protein ACFJIW_11115 [Tahibacter sp. UC22_41]|uniref:hypothetical protein n=1 Tax=Tahibacter sp. UC22_41 TaxID=3350178 RepID=UPI0036DF3F0E